MLSAAAELPTIDLRWSPRTKRDRYGLDWTTVPLGNDPAGSVKQERND